MSLNQAAKNAYTRPEAPARTSRSIEYDLLARITNRLKSAWPKKETEFSAFVEALTDNLRLWSTLAADVAGPDNGLPAPLRAQLFYLYQFTTEHSRSVLDGHGSIDVLVDINTSVMRGLRGEGATR